jgi:probable rRNA maturation factor
VKRLAPIIEISRTVRSTVPVDSDLRKWARAALGAKGHNVELALRIVGLSEGRRLNLLWRGKDRATNVLSFPAADTTRVDRRRRLLGDVVLCAPVVMREANAHGKPLKHHFAHLVVHGCLHLLGYDHESPADAVRMESRERRVLREMGIPDPYQVSLATVEKV